MASVMSLVMMVFMVVPILAPTLGQAVMLVAGWRAILAGIAIFGFFMTIWCFLRLPETMAEADRRPLRVGPVADAFRIVISNRIAAGYGIGAGLIFGCLFGFLNSAQQIYQEIYGVGVYFPLIFSSGAVLLSVASFTNSRFVERFGMRRLSHMALVGFAVSGALLLLFAVLDDGQVPFAAFYLLTFLAFGFFAFIGTNFNALAMDPLGHVAGTASSVVSSLQTFLGGVLGAIVGQAFDGTVLPLSLGFLILSLSSFGVVALTDARRLFGRNDPAAEASTAAQ